jgi:acetyl-CoA acetyltransferase
VSATKRVAIVGAALSDCGRVDTKSPFELHYQGAKRALDDAGLTKADVDGFASNGMGLLAPVEIAEYLGLTPTWFDGTGVGGATWEVMAEHAVEAILAGHAEVVVLAYGSTTRADLKSKRRRANLAFGTRGPVQFDAPYGHALIAKYAMATRRHMYEYGTTIEQLAEIAVSTRYNASLNPDAYYQDPITIDDVQSSAMIADPLTKLHCCIRSDGGGALPTNTDGGGLSACHPGMRGMFLMVEGVRQLRGESTGQGPDAKVACVNATGGWFSSSGTMLLGTE